MKLITRKIFPLKVQVEKKKKKKRTKHIGKGIILTKIKESSTQRSQLYSPFQHGRFILHLFCNRRNERFWDPFITQLIYFLSTSGKASVPALSETELSKITKAHNRHTEPSDNFNPMHSTLTMISYVTIIQNSARISSSVKS